MMTFVHIVPKIIQGTWHKLDERLHSTSEWKVAGALHNPNGMDDPFE